ncbi:MAG TPA: class I SAM-dependent methyltransferase [Solirubrobacterales bacterium]|nr:class I SAM-dependent methyltransferase [Solirubrobacterales bacterium]
MSDESRIPTDALLVEQGDYYRQRAPEYEDWWFRRDRYNRGQEANARWFAEAAEVMAALERFGPRGKVLELACGTGIWTRELARSARRLTAIDGSEEMLALNRAKVEDPTVEYIHADLFQWEPAETYDVCFFGFWLSHVPEVRFEPFWEMVRRALEPEGRVFFLDSARNERASAIDHKLPEAGEETMLRRLKNGEEFQIVKRFHEPESLQDRLAGLGWSVQVKSTPEYFIYGGGSPAASA